MGIPERGIAEKEIFEEKIAEKFSPVAKEINYLKNRHY